jgi:hypothetical protein
MPSSKKDNTTKLLKIIAVFFSPLVVAALIVVAFRTNSWTAKAAGLATAEDVDTVRSQIMQKQNILLRMEFNRTLKECSLPTGEKESLRVKVDLGVITLDSAAIYLMTR